MTPPALIPPAQISPALVATAKLPARQRRGLGAIACALTLLGATFAPPLSAQGTTETPTDAEAGGIDDVGRITEGKIRVLDLLRFMQDITDKLVLYPSAAADPAFGEDVMIEVLGDVEPLTLPMVRALLQTNGYEVWERVLPDGNTTLNVRNATQRVTTPDDPGGPLLVKGELPEQENSQELATLVLQLEHTDTTVVSQALRDLLDIAGSGRPTGSIKMVPVTSSDTLIIKARVEVLEYIRDLTKFIDVEVVGPTPILNIVSLTYADAEYLVSLIEEALDTSATPGTARRATPRAARGAQNNAGAANATLAGESTRLIPDPRTQQIIIQSTDDDEYDLVLHLIDELDTRVRSFRRNTHTYRVKYLKAEDLANVLSSLIDGTGTGGLSRTNRTTRTNRGATQGVNQQVQSTPTRIVPHPETNTLIVQADPEEWHEIENILHDIDARRRQVFLEAALVQVTDSSNLNYTIELLAGNLDDQATRIAAMSAFGISTLAIEELPDNFERQFLGGGTTGLLTAISNDGQLPAIMRAIKSDSESKILATPFILADDNQESSINIDTEIFFETSNTTNVNTTTGLSSESAGIRMQLTPTISKEVVLLNLNLEISSFAGASSSTGQLPDRSTNTITSNVTIPDGSLFIIGGLARENESTVVDKIPLLGDLPLIGRFFQSRGSDHSRDNLYVFLSAHIIDEERGHDLELLSDQAIEGVRSFGDSVRLQRFVLPDDVYRGASLEEKD